MQTKRGEASKISIPTLRRWHDSHDQTVPMEFSPDTRMRAVQELADEFFKNVLYDEEPLFVSDEAKIWDVSTASAEELLTRCTNYFGVSVAAADLQLPLWQLLSELDRRRSERRKDKQFRP